MFAKKKIYRQKTSRFRQAYIHITGAVLGFKYCGVNSSYCVVQKTKKVNLMFTNKKLITHKNRPVFGVNHRDADAASVTTNHRGVDVGSVYRNNTNEYERYGSVVLLSDRIFKQSITQLHKSDKWLTKSTQSVSSTVQRLCLKCPPFASTQALSLPRHCSIAISTVDCSRPHQTSISRCFSSSMV